MSGGIPAFPDTASVFYFLREDGYLLHATTNNREELTKYFGLTNMIKHYAIRSRKDLISMFYDLRANFEEIEIKGVDVKRSEERYNITSNDYFREAVRIAAAEEGK
ncbi:hypothetical protein KAR91_59375 [Candidatus Pacearchaeota archaeon]|nr:hypothetical protein [Candidatus Pacearchaeota archaeon]